MRAPLLRREPAGDIHRGIGRLPRDHGHEQVPILERESRPERRRRLLDRAQRNVQEPPPVDGVADEAGEHPAEADPARQRVLDDEDEERDARRESAEEREERPGDAADRDVRPRAVRELGIGAVLHAQAHDRCVRDVNESVAPSEYSVPTKFTSPGRITRIGAIPAKRTSASHGVLKRGCSRRSASGSCRYVAIE